MAFATGPAKQLRYKKQSSADTLPGATGAQSLRRVESTLDVTKDTYQSNEIRTDMQVSDFRHGVRRTPGNLKGELSPGTYKDFIAAVLRKDFAAVPALSNLSITIAANGSNYTLTRASGSFLTDGVKIGDVVRLTAGGFAAGNLNKNLLVIALTATVATVLALNGSALVAEGPIASATLTIPGKKTYVPASGHTDDMFAIEHWHSDVSLSEVYTGCKIGSAAIDLPPTGMAAISFALTGKDMVPNTSAYYTNPTAVTSTGVVAAVNGVLLVNGIPVAICTGLNIKLNSNLSGEPVVGSNSIPNQFQGRIQVDGQMTAYLQDATLRDGFLNESEVSLIAVLTTSGAANADFIGFTLPRIKLGGATKNDGEKSIIQTLPFTALLNTAGGTGTSGEASTIVVQDSAA